jgi:L-ascorbate metabolism protein UlaG (beta-lactamase superfamily)
VEDRLTYSGHATVVLELGGSRLVTDPLLGRHIQHFLRVRHGLSADELGPVDAVLISHLHHDHLDLPSLRALGKGVPVVCPEGAQTFLRSRGFDELVALAPGESTTIGAVEIRAVPAAHDGNRAWTSAFADPVGYVVSAGARVYFAGDTADFDEMEDLGEDLDVALMPIWGWGPTLGGGHLDPERAARAADLVGARVTVPIHWGAVSPIGAPLLWPRLLVEPAERFARAAEDLGVPIRILHPGESLGLAGALP